MKNVHDQHAVREVKDLNEGRAAPCSLITVKTSILPEMNQSQHNPIQMPSFLVEIKKLILKFIKYRSF